MYSDYEDQFAADCPSDSDWDSWGEEAEARGLPIEQVARENGYGRAPRSREGVGDIHK